MGLNAEDGGDDPGDDGQTDHAPMTGAIQSGAGVPWE